MGRKKKVIDNENIETQEIKEIETLEVKEEKKRDIPSKLIKFIKGENNNANK
jgi:hypothetical protein